jgi:hypothetical protein
MKPFQTKTFLLTASLCAALAACGGGDDSTTPTATPTPAASSFAACFDVTAGVAYTMTDPDAGGVSDGVLMLQESFEGVVRSATVELVNATSVRSSATYWSQESNGIRFRGAIDYDGTGTAEWKTVLSDGFLLPLNMQAGQTADLNYTETRTYLSGPQAGQTETSALHEGWTFEGFETLTLGGRTFTDVCRIKVSPIPAGEDGPTTLWLAKGFGMIRVQNTSGDGAIVEESHLETITAQP